jgi:hypothetical protein
VETNKDNDISRVDTKDREKLGDQFSGRSGGGLGWGDVGIRHNNSFNITLADGTSKSVVWGSFFPRIVVASFSSPVPSRKSLTSRTGYGFVGVRSLARRISDSESAFQNNGNNGQWSVLVADVQLNGVDVKNVTYVRSISVYQNDGNSFVSNTSIIIENLIAKADGQLLVNDQLVDVAAGDIKSTFTVNNWPFAPQADNKLRFAVYVSSNGKGVQNVTQQWAGAQFQLGSGYVLTPTSATVDGVSQPVNVTRVVDDDGSDDGDDVRALYVFSFPSFTNSLVYDPVSSLSVGSLSVGLNGASLASLSTMITLLLSAVAALLVV